MRLARLSRFMARFGLYRQRHYSRRCLLTLDDRLLKDIGLSRTDALREGSKPFWKD
ncbi:DUF1127 domain-containing protein [Halomonas sp. McH1-25]|uniref:DUF1127 domain-containing protein n=1 Tax=unclassified Halomonas TaxID=2609666 RepID=UPI001EF5D0CC|nr:MULTISPECIES: DUF1127 domain-containing protein [unclassified Halomonas]MCG7601242.1 DUF1127 domain-containing protein [Halomonas sp. McH1-25]MCP1343700.1 DUF1127 domain-containing protein [Halomonas sp. FL8]MCP1362110.1 DUF1127 domain-containing protein [Halomonas sp. BBD45]